MEDEAADIELLEQHLIKTSNISQRMTSILTNFDTRLLRLEKSISPLHKSTQSLTRLSENIEATLQSIDKIASDREGVAAEEALILRGPRPNDLATYIEAVDRLNATIAFSSNDSRSTRDTSRLVETGAKKLAQLYTKLVAEGSSGNPPQSSSGQPPQFPPVLLQNLEPLVRALRSLPVPATHPSHPAGGAILQTLKEAQKGYGDMRGSWSKKCLESIGGRRIIDRVDSLPGLQGGREVGRWVESLIAIASYEYQLLNTLAPLTTSAALQPTYSTILAPLLSLLSTTTTLLVNLVKSSLNKYVFLALATYDALSGVQQNWNDIIRKAGRKENELKEGIASLWAICVRSFPEFLLDVRAASTPKAGEIGTGIHEVTSLSVSYLTQIPEVLDAVGAALVTLGDGKWKMGEGAPKIFEQSGQDDERIVVEHYVYDVVTTLLSSLSTLAAAHRRPAHGAIFHLNNIAYLRNRLLLSPETPIDDLLSKPTQDALNSNYRTAKAVYFDANYSPLVQALGDAGKKVEAKDKLTRFFDALDEVVERHRTSRVLPDDEDGREMLEEEVVRLVVPALQRFNQTTQLGKSSTKYVRATPDEVERTIRGLYR